VEQRSRVAEKLIVIDFPCRFRYEDLTVAKFIGGFNDALFCLPSLLQLFRSMIALTARGKLSCLSDELTDSAGR
jgi:hypothetical protein